MPGFPPVGRLGVKGDRQPFLLIASRIAVNSPLLHAPPVGGSTLETLRAKLASGTVPVVSLDALGSLEADGTQVVALHSGRLEGLHATALRRSPPALLLACREPSGLPSAWEVRLLSDLLGGAPLLPSAALSHVVSRVGEFPQVCARAGEVAQAAGASRAAQDICADLAHELLANALYDAPAFADGTPKYAHRRGPGLEIDPQDCCEFAIQVRDDRIYLSVTDKFGRLTPAPVVAAVEGLEGRARVNAAGGGAGLGLRRILEQSDVFAVKVRPGESCQVVCAIGLGQARRRGGQPKSLFYVVERG